MTDDELVEKMALAMLALSQKRAVETGHDIHLILSDFDRDAARAALAAARPVIRAQALEEAARVAEYRIGAAEWSAETNSGYECASKEIAAAIRALKETA